MGDRDVTYASFGSKGWGKVIELTKGAEQRGYERGVKDALAAAMDACQDGVISPTIFSDIRDLLK